MSPETFVGTSLSAHDVDAQTSILPVIVVNVVVIGTFAGNNFFPHWDQFQQVMCNVLRRPLLSNGLHSNRALLGTTMA